jgi:hypothetical protein
MFGTKSHKIKLEGELFRKVKAASDMLSCTIDEFVGRVLEREAEKTIMSANSKDVSASDVQDIENSLKGLGYLE